MLRHDRFGNSCFRVSSKYCQLRLTSLECSYLEVLEYIAMLPYQSLSFVGHSYKTAVLKFVRIMCGFALFLFFFSATRSFHSSNQIVQRKMQSIFHFPTVFRMCVSCVCTLGHYSSLQFIKSFAVSLLKKLILRRKHIKFYGRMSKCIDVVVFLFFFEENCSKYFKNFSNAL